jgi:hypothetical protein
MTAATTPTMPQNNRPRMRSRSHRVLLLLVRSQAHVGRLAASIAAAMTTIAKITQRT